MDSIFYLAGLPVAKPNTKPRPRAPPVQTRSVIQPIGIVAMFKASKIVYTTIILI